MSRRLQYFIITFLVCIEICSSLEFGIFCTPVDTLQPTIEIWITPQGTEIAFKGAMIGDIEPGRCSVSTDIRFGKLISCQIFLFAQDFLHLVHCLEYSTYVFLICDISI